MSHPTSPTPDEIFAARWERARHAPSDLEAWIDFASVFARSRFTADADVSGLLDALLACLAQERLDPQPLADTATRLLRRHPEIGPLVRLAGTPGGTGETLSSVLDSPGVLSALERTVVALTLTRLILPAMDFERLFTGVRRALVLGRLAPAALTLPAALARQCFLNGYVWVFDDEEVEAVEILAASLNVGSLGPGDAPSICLLASYVPLWSWDRSDEVVGLARAVGDPWFSGMVRQQVEEPGTERLLEQAIPTLAMADDAVSDRVRRQYEEHPYPRWITVNARRHTSVSDAVGGALGRRVQHGAREDHPRILVAGCGTGRQLAQVALRFPGAEIVGIDLSMPSLAYAARRCSEMGLEGISLARADILALDGWDERFDLVECGGVLHHLDDPLRGWRILTELLVPHGLMRIALYSERARRHVVRARALIESEGLEPTPDTIRALRPLLAERFGDEGGGLLRWLDFYSLEECRDLLFHVQEHRFTLPEIRNALEELRLTFLGFELPDTAVGEEFASRHPGLDPAESLGAWDAWEVEHPDTFRGMYQFWVRGGDGRG